MWHDDGQSNPSRSTPSFEEVLARRAVLKGAGALAVGTLIGAPLLSQRSLAAAPSPLTAALRQKEAPLGAPGFVSVPVSNADTVVVPPGYRAEVLISWGDPISDARKVFKPDASNTAAEQAAQWGMHNDGMHFFPLNRRGVLGIIGGDDSTRGLLVANHEYTDDGLLHTDGMATWTAEKVRKSQAAHGVSVIEVKLDAASGRWQVVRPSAYARRITASTPMKISGPARGHAWLSTSADPFARTVLGTINNCGHGYTPWGTYLACEENFNGYFVNRGSIPADQARYGISASGGGYRWHEFDERFDLAKHPNEANRHGWVVEIDPFAPTTTPVKRTALGRFKHEGAFVTLAADGRAVVYMGDDERFEYIYKFVSSGRFNPDKRSANLNLLNEGTLYAARFYDNGMGEWVALEYGKNGIGPESGFDSQAEICIRTRQAADVVGATRMDRPEWIGANPVTGEVYCTLTNNNQRGSAGRPTTNPANPRADNIFGHIIRWNELGQDAAATAFQWDLLVQCGDPDNANPAKRGNIIGDKFGSPDGLWCDERGLIWVQTDISTSTVGQGDYAGIGNNQMLAGDPYTGEFRRFLTGPKGCEITGLIMTPDMRSMFINVQHPGEPASERNDPANPTAISAWPGNGARPRSSCVVIQREDGGVIGT